MNALVPFTPKDATLVLSRKQRAGGTIWLGMAAITIFFGGFGAWAAMTPLNSAAVAPGSIVVAGNRQVVQHREGGLVSELAVRNGDRVASGQVVIRLDDRLARAEVDALASRRRVLIATEARLIAERDFRDSIEVPGELLALATQPSVAETILTQIEGFRLKREATLSQFDILHNRGQQLARSAAGLEAQLAAVRRQALLIAREESTVADLVRRGLERMPRLLALQREAANLAGQEGRLIDEIARTSIAIGETQLQASNIRHSYSSDAATALRDIQGQIYETTERLRAAEEILRRTVIRAPADGIAMNVAVHTIGAVVAPGERLLEIVPHDDVLVIEAMLQPNDIAEIRPDMEAVVTLTAFTHLNLPVVVGRVQSISPDRIEDPRTGLSHFLMRVIVDRGSFERTAGRQLHAGMPAEVMVPTSARTALTYVIQPLIRRIDTAMREH